MFLDTLSISIIAIKRLLCFNKKKIAALLLFKLHTFFMDYVKQWLCHGCDNSWFSMISRSTDQLPNLHSFWLFFCSRCNKVLTNSIQLNWKFEYLSKPFLHLFKHKMYAVHIVPAIIFNVGLHHWRVVVHKVCGTGDLHLQNVSDDSLQLPLSLFLLYIHFNYFPGGE